MKYKSLLKIIIAAYYILFVNSLSCTGESQIVKENECVLKCGYYPDFILNSLTGECLPTCDTSGYIKVPEDEPVLLTKLLVNFKDQTSKHIFLRKSSDNRIFFSNLVDKHYYFTAGSDINKANNTFYLPSIMSTANPSSEPFYNSYTNNIDYFLYIDSSKYCRIYYLLNNTDQQLSSIQRDDYSEFSVYEDGKFSFIDLKYQSSKYMLYIGFYDFPTGSYSSFHPKKGTEDVFFYVYDFKGEYFFQKYLIAMIYGCSSGTLTFYHYYYNTTNFDVDNGLKKTYSVSSSSSIKDRKYAYLTDSSNYDFAINCVMLNNNNIYCMFFKDKLQSGTSISIIIEGCSMINRNDFLIDTLKNSFVVGCGESSLKIQLIKLSYSSSSITVKKLASPYTIQKDSFVNYDFKTFNDYYLLLIGVKEETTGKYNYYTDTISFAFNGDDLTSIANQYDMLTFYYSSSNSNVIKCKGSCLSCTSADSCTTSKTKIYTCEQGPCTNHSPYIYKNENECDITCNSLLYYISGTERLCVDKCPDSLPYITNGDCTNCKKCTDTCSTSCGSGTKYYIQNTTCCTNSCPSSYYTYKINSTAYRCLTNCSYYNVLEQESSNECLSSCTGNNIAINGKCSQCSGDKPYKFLTSDNNYSCLSEDDCNSNSYLIDESTKECYNKPLCKNIDANFKLIYGTNKCTSTCPSGYPLSYYDETNSQYTCVSNENCKNNLNLYVYNNSECINGTKCKNEYLKYIIEEEKRCVSNCYDEPTYNITVSETSTCVNNCKDDYNLLYNNQSDSKKYCIDTAKCTALGYFTTSTQCKTTMEDCSGSTPLIYSNNGITSCISINKCINELNNYYTDSECLNKNECLNSNKYIIEETKQCLANCDLTYNKKLEGSKYCYSICPSEYPLLYIKSETNEKFCITQSTCISFYNLYSSGSTCMTKKECENQSFLVDETTHLCSARCNNGKYRVYDTGNCVNNCPESNPYLYFSVEKNEYLCLTEEYCRNSFNSFIDTKNKKCISKDECLSNSFYIIEENNQKQCVETCKSLTYDIIYNGSKCVSTCSNTDLPYLTDENTCIGNCSSPYQYKLDDLKMCIKEESIPRYIKSAYDNNITLIIKKDEIIEIISQNNVNDFINNETINLTYIDLGDCEEKLKKEYSLAQNDSLYIYKKERLNNNSLINDVSYVVYDKNNRQLNLDVCNNSNILMINPYYNNIIDEEILSGMSFLLENGVEVANKKDSYFTNICKPYKFEGKYSKVPLVNRLNYLLNNNNLCASNCKLIKINTSKKLSTCNCDPSLNENNESSKQSTNSEILPKNILFNSNLYIIVCFKEAFTDKNLFKGKEFYIFTFIILCQILCFIFLIIYSYNYLYALLNRNISPFKFNSSKIFDSSCPTPNTPVKKTNNFEEESYEDYSINAKNNSYKNKYQSNNKNNVSLSSFNESKVGKLQSKTQLPCKVNKFESSSSMKNNTYIEHSDKTFLLEDYIFMDYQTYAEKDKRSFTKILSDTMKMQIELYHTFFLSNDINLKPLKISLFIFNIMLTLTINELYINSNIQNKSFNKDGYVLTFQKILICLVFRFILSSLLNFLIRFDIGFMKIKNDKKNYLGDKVKKYTQFIKIKIILYYIIVLVISGLCYVFLVTFSSILYGFQVIGYIDFAISVGLSILLTIANSFIIALLRVSKIKFLYIISYGLSLI